MPDPPKAPSGPETDTDPKNFIAGKPATRDLQRLAAHDDGLLADGQQHRRCGHRLSRRRLSDSRHRPRRHRSLRLADCQGDHLHPLKYRVPAPHSGKYWGAYPQSPIALEDAQRALGLVRLHAAEWHIDPHKIGVLGFSAGGHLVAATSVHSDRIYPLIDAADKVSCRPDFAIALYPGHLSFGDKEFVKPELNPDIRAHLTAQVPPTFILQNEDDHVDGINQSLVYYIALKNAGVPVEMHLYAQGGHAFGLRPTKLPVSHWPQLVETWLSHHWNIASIVPHRRAGCTIRNGALGGRPRKSATR